MKDILTLADFTAYTLPFDQLDKHNIYYPYPDGYWEQVYILDEEVKVKNLFLDDLCDFGSHPCTFRALFVFRKKVLVDNALIQQEKDHGPIVIFQDDVTAKNIWLGGGDIFFHKNVSTSQSFIGVYNHGTTVIHGNLSAQIAISDDHYLDIKGDKTCQYIFIDKTCSPYPLKSIVQKQYYAEEDECLHLGKIYRAIERGTPIATLLPPMTELEKRIARMEKSKDKILNLSFMDLKNLPDRIWHLTSLAGLDLTGNCLNHLPEECAQLQQIKSIDLTGNEFSSFPTVLCQLTELKEISLDENPLSLLPNEIRQLTQLEKLSLNACSFTAFPDVLYELPSLKQLEFSAQESETPLCLNQAFPKLQRLNLSLNPTPKILTLTSSLRELDLSGCHLTDLPSTVVQHTLLKKLMLLDNPLPEFPRQINHMSQLTELGFDLALMSSHSVEILKKLNKLSKLVLHNPIFIEHEKVELILQIEGWSRLCTTNPIEDMFTLQQLVQRENLKSLSMGDEKINLPKLRARFRLWQ